MHQSAVLENIVLYCLNQAILCLLELVDSSPPNGLRLSAVKSLFGVHITRKPSWIGSACAAQLHVWIISFRDDCVFISHLDLLERAGAYKRSCHW